MLSYHSLPPQPALDARPRGGAPHGPLACTYARAVLAGLLCGCCPPAACRIDWLLGGGEPEAARPREGPCARLAAPLPCPPSLMGVPACCCYLLPCRHLPSSTMCWRRRRRGSCTGATAAWCAAARSLCPAIQPSACCAAFARWGSAALALGAAPRLAGGAAAPNTRNQAPAPPDSHSARGCTSHPPTHRRRRLP